jgi:GGDEF domain-containing protein
VHEVRGVDASVGLVVDGSFALQGSITGDVISETVAGLQVAVRSAEVAWSQSHLIGRDATTGLLSRPAFVAVLDSTIARAEHRSEQVGLVAVAVDEAAELRAGGGGEKVDAMMGRMAETLAAEWGDNAVARVGRDHLAVIVTGADELELIGARDGIRHAAAVAIRPRGIAPRTYRCVVGVSLSSVHGVDSERLIDHAIDESITSVTT